MLTGEFASKEVRSYSYGVYFTRDWDLFVSKENVKFRKKMKFEKGIEFVSQMLLTVVPLKGPSRVCI